MCAGGTGAVGSEEQQQLLPASGTFPERFQCPLAEKMETFCLAREKDPRQAVSSLPPCAQAYHPQDDLRTVTYKDVLFPWLYICSSPPSKCIPKFGLQKTARVYNSRLLLDSLCIIFFKVGAGVWGGFCLFVSLRQHLFWQGTVHSHT